MMDYKFFEPIDVEKEIQEETLRDARELASSINKLNEIQKDLLNMIDVQSESLECVEENTKVTEAILDDTNINLTKAAKYSKLKYIPLVLGGSVGAFIFGVPAAPFIGTYSLLTALGGGVIGSVIGNSIGK